MSDEHDAVWMAFDASGNAFDVVDYTPEALEEKAREMREAAGEITTVTMDQTPFACLSDGSSTR